MLLIFVLIGMVQPPVTTAVLKVALHCQGCIEKINKTVFKTKGEVIIFSLSTAFRYSNGAIN